ncbi:MAG: hypothetical protein QM490_05815 [Candidatus Gracilibacteria bacterium]
MLRKIFIIGILLFSGINIVSAAAPEVNCIGLPGCVDDDKMTPSPANVSDNMGIEFITSIIGQVIQFVAVIAVIALILSGMLYLFSGGDEEKVKKAKSWIIWSLAGVVLSISAWGLVNILDKIIISNN